MILTLRFFGGVSALSDMRGIIAMFDFSSTPTASVFIQRYFYFLRCKK